MGYQAYLQSVGGRGSGAGGSRVGGTDGGGSGDGGSGDLPPNPTRGGRGSGSRTLGLRMARGAGRIPLRRPGRSDDSPSDGPSTDGGRGTHGEVQRRDTVNIDNDDIKVVALMTHV